MGPVSFGGEILRPPSIDLTLEDDVKYFGLDSLNGTQTILEQLRKVQGTVLEMVPGVCRTVLEQMLKG